MRELVSDPCYEGGSAPRAKPQTPLSCAEGLGHGGGRSAPAPPAPPGSGARTRTGAPFEALRKTQGTLAPPPKHRDIYKPPSVVKTLRL